MSIVAFHKVDGKSIRVEYQEHFPDPSKKNDAKPYTGISLAPPMADSYIRQAATLHTVNISKALLNTDSQGYRYSADSQIDSFNSGHTTKIQVFYGVSLERTGKGEAARYFLTVTTNGTECVFLQTLDQVAEILTEMKKARY